MDELTVKNITKKYSKKAALALKNFDYAFSNGVYGLLGPNGAGKSTLMNIIVGNLAASEGEVFYHGADIRTIGEKYRSILGYMPQQQQLYDGFTIKRFLYYFAALKGLSKKEANERIAELLHIVGLYEFADWQLKTLSGGMKQRVLLAQALLNDPEVLILDEPTAGLDPRERMNIRNYIYSIAEKKTILIATHVISDVEQIAKEVIFLRKGEIVLSGTPEQVAQEIGPFIWEVDVLKEDYRRVNEMYPSNRVAGERDGLVSVKVISEKRPELQEVRSAAVGLEDVYMYLYPNERR